MLTLADSEDLQKQHSDTKALNRGLYFLMADVMREKYHKLYV